MASGCVLNPDIRGVTVLADKVSILVDPQQLFIQILSRPDFVVTLSAPRDGNVGLQTSERCCFRDVDVAGRTLQDVILLLTAAFMNELRRDARGLSQHVRCWGEFVTAVAVRGDWFLRFPVTVEAR